MVALKTTITDVKETLTGFNAPGLGYALA